MPQPPRRNDHWRKRTVPYRALRASSPPASICARRPRTRLCRVMAFHERQACRSRSFRNMTTGGASAMPTARKAGSISRFFGKRTAITAPWLKNDKGTIIAMRREAGRNGGRYCRSRAGRRRNRVRECTGQWCRLDMSECGLDQAIGIMGVYPGEVLTDGTRPWQRCQGLF